MMTLMRLLSYRGNISMWCLLFAAKPCGTEVEDASDGIKIDAIHKDGSRIVASILMPIRKFFSAALYFGLSRALSLEEEKYFQKMCRLGAPKVAVRK